MVIPAVDEAEQIARAVASAEATDAEVWVVDGGSRDASIGVTPTCVRVPVVRGHSESVHVQFKQPLSAKRAIELLRGAPGVTLVEGEYKPGAEPQPLQAAGTDPVYVGRVRDDLAVPGAINLWVVSDNLLKGAALNAVQIAETLVR